MAFSYIPQRGVSDNTKAAGIRILSIIEDVKIIMESHDALLFSMHDRYLDTYCPVIKREMERPISFENCSLKRRMLKIPCDIEIGYNYQELSKYKQIKAQNEPVELKVEKGPLDGFLVESEYGDSYKESKIAECEEWKKQERDFLVE
jgi:hypothetical protein